MNVKEQLGNTHSLRCSRAFSLKHRKPCTELQSMISTTLGNLVKASLLLSILPRSECSFPRAGHLYLTVMVPYRVWFIFKQFDIVLVL